MHTMLQTLSGVTRGQEALELSRCTRLVLFQVLILGLALHREPRFT